MKELLLFFFIVLTTSVSAQMSLTEDEQLNKNLLETGLLHRPLPLDTTKSFEAYGLKKKVLYSRQLSELEDNSGWSHSGLAVFRLHPKEVLPEQEVCG